MRKEYYRTTSSLKHRGFTLVEVMISVVIISTVIMALLELYSNNSHIFLNLEKKSKVNQPLSFVLSNPDYGFDDKKISLDKLLEGFDVESELRRELKSTKVEIIYKELERIDLAEYEDKIEEIQYDTEVSESNSGMVFEIGRTILKLDDSSSSILRIKTQ